MNTTYKSRSYVASPSPYQPARKTAFDVSGAKHPVQEEIQKLLGTYNLAFTFEQDKQTLELFKNIPGIICFLCTIRNGDHIIGQGRGAAVISRMNKYIERTVNSAFYASFVDSCVRSKILDTLHLGTMPQLQNSHATNTDVAETYTTKGYSEFEMITDKQRSYLLQLYSVNIADEDLREQQVANVDNLTKEEASDAIKSLAR